MDSQKHDADSEDFGGPPDSPDELLANARAGIKAFEGRLKERVKQHIDACLAAALAEAADTSDVLREPDKEREKRRSDAKWKASKWKTDVERPSGILGLFKSCLLEVMNHIDALPDRAVQASLMVNLGFLLRASGSTAHDLMDESDELKARKRLDDIKTHEADRATKIASAQVDEIILKHASPFWKGDRWGHGTPKKIQPGVNEEITKLNDEKVAARESLPRNRRPKPLKKLETSAISHRLARLKKDGRTSVLE